MSHPTTETKSVEWMGQMIYEKVETYTPDLSEENEKIYDEFSMKKKIKGYE